MLFHHAVIQNGLSTAHTFLSYKTQPNQQFVHEEVLVKEKGLRLVAKYVQLFDLARVVLRHLLLLHCRQVLLACADNDSRVQSILLLQEVLFVLCVLLFEGFLWRVQIMRIGVLLLGRVETLLLLVMFYTVVVDVLN